MIEEEAPKCYIPRSLDWQGWAGTVATSITGPNPLDFFLWGDMKRLVYETPIDTAEDLVARVVEAAHVIRDNVGLLERCRHAIVRRYQLCNAFNERQSQLEKIEKLQTSCLKRALCLPKYTPSRLVYELTREEFYLAELRLKLLLPVYKELQAEESEHIGGVLHKRCCDQRVGTGRLQVEAHND
ncbi:hypothetical protein ANN_19736 [Periplaneta americana]|uniref:Uncharacterized protein n=1 Tax=Periplaneta americana TaxID=6978 RepID=A0ABQ8SAP7_PERAM|nr:hypothetical protein ANN_19736 [Periplaneta americana]